MNTYQVTFMYHGERLATVVLCEAVSESQARIDIANEWGNIVFVSVERVY